LGSELQNRGHRVALIGGQRLAQETASRAGLEFCELGAGDQMVDRFDEEWRKLGESKGIGSMLQTGRLFGLAAKFQLKHLPEVLGAQNFDGLIIDQLSPAAYVVAREQSVPAVFACNALAMQPDPVIPPPPLFWGFRDDAYGRFRNRIAKSLLIPVYDWLADCKATGISPLMLVFDVEQGLARIAQQPEFFDFPRQTTASHVHYTGPWHRSERDDATTDFPWDWLDDRPLIYASMGTLQNKLTQVFEMIMEAVADLPMQVVLSKGGGGVNVVKRIPDNVLVVESAPQLRLLERAALAITHAGLNTALECLSHGVPMLCLPVTNDQPGVAKRVEWIGAGRAIPVGRVTVRKLKTELARLLEDPSYATAAKAIQRQLSETPGLEMAAEVIEKAFINRQEERGRTSDLESGGNAQA
jgi:MGT family glycosyltransferase